MRPELRTEFKDEDHEREDCARGLIPAKRRLVASFKLALVKVCQGQGQGQGQFKIPDPATATATAIARVRSRVRGSVSECRKSIAQRLSIACAIVVGLNSFVFVFVFKNLQLFRWPFRNVLIMFWWILYAPLVVADLDFDHGFRRLLHWSSLPHLWTSQHLSNWTSTLPSVQRSSAQRLSSSVFRSAVWDLRSS